MPRNSEELRSKLRLLGHALTFMSTQFERDWLSDMTPTVWYQYANYILGAKVMQLKMRSGDKGEE
eukprot:9417053-Karenia_brevis.AAC.1